MPGFDGTRAWLDATILVIVLACTSATYVGGLGLYLDDWSFVWFMRGSADQSVAGLYATLAAHANLAVRPVQILWLIASHKLSPGAVWPMHVANHLAFAAAILLLHAGLRAIPSCRAAAFSIALIYACLANFTASRLWLANHQGTLSLLFFALAFVAVTRMARDERGRWPAMATAVLAFGVASNLAYELFGFLLPLVPLFVWRGWGRSWRETLSDRRFQTATLAASAGFLAATAYKLSFRIAIGQVPRSPDMLAAYVPRAVWMYAEAAVSSFWTAGLYAPRAALGVAAGEYASVAALAVTGLVAVVLLWRLRPWQGSDTSGEPEEASPSFFALSGAAAFVLGYAPFLTNLWYLSYPWGPNNRGNIAAALGVALLFHAGLRVLGKPAPRLARWALVVVCLSGVFLQVSIGRMWDLAADRQAHVLAPIRAAALRLDAGDTLLVYGLCPYVRVAPVFAYRGYDLTMALRLSGLERGTADILTPSSQLQDDAVVVPDAVSRTSERYRYGSIAVLDLRDGSFTPIDSHAAAQAYFAGRSLALPTGCRYHKEQGGALY